MSDFHCQRPSPLLHFTFNFPEDHQRSAVTTMMWTQRQLAMTLSRTSLHVCGLSSAQRVIGGCRSIQFHGPSSYAEHHQ